MPAGTVLTNRVRSGLVVVRAFMKGFRPAGSTAFSLVGASVDSASVDSAFVDVGSVMERFLTTLTT